MCDEGGGGIAREHFVKPIAQAYCKYSYAKTFTKRDIIIHHIINLLATQKNYLTMKHNL